MHLLTKVHNKVYQFASVGVHYEYVRLKCKNELKTKNEKIMKNQLIEALIKYFDLSKYNYDCIENIEIKLDDKYSVVISEQDLKNYFEIQERYKNEYRKVRRRIKENRRRSGE